MIKISESYPGFVSHEPKSSIKHYNHLALALVRFTIIQVKNIDKGISLLYTSAKQQLSIEPVGVKN